MKKILHISNYYHPHVGGIETTAQNIVDILKTTGEYEQKVICFGDGPNIVDDIPVIRLPYSIRISSQAISFRYRKVLKQTIKEFQPDVVIIHTPNPLIEDYFNRCHFTGKIIVYHHLDIYRQKILKHFVKPVTNKTNKRADVIICSSDKYVDGSKELRNYKDKIRVIPLCYKEEDLELTETESEEVRRIREKYQGKTILFYSGRHARFKGVKYALRAIKNMDDVVFLVGRIGPMYAIVNKQIAYYKNAVSLGLLDRSQYRTYLHASDIFIFPSITKNESFGITLLEAVALGKPCITFNIPGSGVNYVSPNNVTGIECDNRSIVELRKAITELKNNPSLRAKYSQNGINRAKELFSYNRFAASIVALVREISNK
ncbi:MAG: glycosyltransferase [Bacilli bacterium]|nr:glycosyltransferase [Bacilli bacterium]